MGGELVARDVAQPAHLTREVREAVWSVVPADPPAQLRDLLAHRRGWHLTQVERRGETLQYRVLQAAEGIAIVVRVDGDGEGLAHPLGERPFGRRRHAVRTTRPQSSSMPIREGSLLLMSVRSWGQAEATTMQSSSARKRT